MSRYKVTAMRQGLVPTVFHKVQYMVKARSVMDARHYTRMTYGSYGEFHIVSVEID